MRVLIINTYYDPEMVGGAEHSVKKLAEQLARMGVECGVLCTGDHDENCGLNGVRIFRRRMKKRSRSIDVGGKSRGEKLVHRLQELGCLGNLSVIGSVLDEFRPDAVHTNCLYDITPVVWLAARKRNIRVVHTLRDYYLICPRVQLMRRGTETRCRNPRIVCRAYRMLNRWCSGFVDAVTAPSQFALGTVLNEGLFRGCRSEVVFNAVECGKEKLRHEIGTEFTFLYLGELTQKKGLEWLLNAFEQLEEQNCRLMIAGRGELESLVRARGESDERLLFLGHLNADGVDQALENADVLICPSLWEEPFGRVVIEAYSHGIPVISSDRGALSEIVEHGMMGMIVPAGDVVRLTEAMRVYEQNRDLWQEHARNAARAAEKFSLENQARRFMEIYGGKTEANRA